ncbi:hypothetical protein PN51_16935 [Vibrio anguillarum]|nr:hypothetical protein PN51_16935 [Vibrio anguillarum]
MNLLGVELRISNSGSSKKVDKRTKEVFDRRFKPYKNVKLLSGKTRVYTSKLWIGLNDVSVHRFGPIKELAGSRIKDGSGEIHNNAFIKKFRTDSHPFAVQRHVTAETSKARRKYSVIKKDIADEVEEIISSLEPEINGMFEEFFYAELRQVLSKSK